MVIIKKLIFHYFLSIFTLLMDHHMSPLLTSMSYIIYIADIMIVGSNCSLLVVGGHVYMTSSESAVTSTRHRRRWFVVGDGVYMTSSTGFGWWLVVTDGGGKNLKARE